MNLLRRMILKPEAGIGRLFALTVQFLIVLSLITFSIDTLPDLTIATKSLLNLLEMIIVIIFTIEYVLRFVVAEKKRAFVFSFFGIIDLLAILPFYLSLGLDLRTLRIVRLLRLFRILKLTRYSAAMQRFQKALALAKEEIVLYFVATGMIIYLSAVGIYYFENPVQPEAFSSVIHSLWWAVTTLTTVGYGDIYPITAGGRVFTFFVLLAGLSIVSVLPGLIASAMNQAKKDLNNR